jgi:Flp pilus assembly protein TadG
MRLAPPRRPFATARASADPASGRGQGLVEFALILTPLMLLLMGIIQFGFIFNTYITVTNATREAARAGTIYVYDRTLATKGLNDAARNDAIKTTLTGSLNYLPKNAPRLTIGGSWTQSGTTFTNGDLVVAYTLPSGVNESDPRTGQQVTVRVTYHQDLLIPLIAALLPRDSGGRLPIPGETTMVIN